MQLLSGLLPGWVWLILMAVCLVPVSISARNQRRKLLAAAARPGAGKAERDAINKQVAGGIGLAAIVGAVAGLSVLPDPYAMIVLAIALALSTLVMWRFRQS